LIANYQRPAAERTSAHTGKGTNMPPTTKTPVMGAVLDAMRSVQTESDRWNLAEALQRQVPTGLKGFSEIIDAANAAGVAGNLSATTLRLYRDAAVRWPSDKRVKDVSFSAHREAMVLGDTAAAAKMLDDLVKSNGADKVTVASVRRAIAVKQGKPQAAARAARGKGATPAAATIDEAFTDLLNGGPKLIAKIKSDSTQSTLDKLHAGLTKTIAHVERLRAKQARAKQPPKVAAPAAKPAPSNGKSKTPVKKTRGDLRGL
jgi:hypothetical protein